MDRSKFPRVPGGTQAGKGVHLLVVDGLRYFPHPSRGFREVAEAARGLLTHFTSRIRFGALEAGDASLRRGRLRPYLPTRSHSF
jgi:hypothetical protein